MTAVRLRFVTETKLPVDARQLSPAKLAGKTTAELEGLRLLVHLLRVHSLVFAVNKLDAVEDPALAWKHIQGALQAFAQAAVKKKITPLTRVQIRCRPRLRRPRPPPPAPRPWRGSLRSSSDAIRAATCRLRD